MKVTLKTAVKSVKKSCQIDNGNIKNVIQMLNIQYRKCRIIMK